MPLYSIRRANSPTAVPISGDQCSEFLGVRRFTYVARFGVDAIPPCNGGLFANAEVIPLLPPEIVQLVRAAERDWSNFEPSIFGTLFKRTLDPAKRSQTGAHYASYAQQLARS